MTDIGSIPAKGSSRRRNFGFKARARAISTLLLSPPDNCIPFVLRNFFKSIFQLNSQKFYSSHLYPVFYQLLELLRYYPLLSYP